MVPAPRPKAVDRRSDWTSLALYLGVPTLLVVVALSVPASVISRSTVVLRARARGELDVLQRGIVAYRKDHGGRPPVRLADLLAPGPRGAYLPWSEIPLDPWGRLYHYESWGPEPFLVSFGADDRPGGEGADADIAASF